MKTNYKSKFYTKTTPRNS